MSNRNTSNKIYLALAISSAFLLSACSPNVNNELVEIAPNKTAFLIKLEGDNLKEQNKFQSEEFLEKNKIATRRITIEHKLVNLCQNCIISHEWKDVPAYRLIQIDRTPVTREWTSNAVTGTSPKNQSFHVETNESIDFGIGANITANITEKDAAKFLYHYGGKQLEDVIDQDVRGFISSSLSQQFGSQSLDYGRTHKVEIFSKAFSDAKEYFIQYGITISRLGFTEGMNYTDSNIQKAINQKFEADMNAEIAKKTLEAAETNAKAKEAVKAQQEFELRKAELEIEKLKVQKWNGVNSSTLVGGDSKSSLNVNIK
jgi:hypothetical protein